MPPFFGIRSGFAIKLGKTESLPDHLYPQSLIHYFNNYRDAYRYVFSPSFASKQERSLIQQHRLDLVIYTDGGQRNSNDGAWAYSFNGAQYQIGFDSHYISTKNNNYCELEAEVQALHKLIQLRWYNKRIQLDTDSISVKNITRNILHGISIQSIARNSEWKIGQLRTLKKFLHWFTHFKIQKIKGHSGILGNQLVHQLCSKSMSSIYPHSFDPFRINRNDYLGNGYFG